MVIVAIVIVGIIAAVAYYLTQSSTSHSALSQAGNGKAGVATVGSLPINTTGIQGAPHDTEESP